MLNKLITPAVLVQDLVATIKSDKEMQKSIGRAVLIVISAFMIVFVSLSSLETRHDSYSKSSKYLSVGEAYNPLPTQLRWKDSF
jgi:hypothetical protein